MGGFIILLQAPAKSANVLFEKLKEDAAIKVVKSIIGSF